MRKKSTAPSYSQKAKRKWGRKAASIQGTGRYALLAWCRTLTVTLWDDLEEAEARKGIIDRGGCGGRCVGHHEIVDLNLN
jgi:hypothetical protein